MASINENLLLGNNSSITNIRNSFDKLVNQLAETSLYNILRNSRMVNKIWTTTDDVSGDGHLFNWVMSAGTTVTIESLNEYAQINFTGLNNTISQTLQVNTIPDPQPDPVTGANLITQARLEPNTEYLLSLNLVPQHDIEVTLDATGGLFDLTLEGLGFTRTITSTSGKVYFVFRTNADFNDMTLTITNKYAGANAVVNKDLRLTKGNLELFNSTEQHFFLDCLKYGTYEMLVGETVKTMYGWQITDNGSDWIPFKKFITREEVFARLQGLVTTFDCRVATTADITLSGLQTIDGISLIATNRVLVKNQTDKKLNGIYVVDAGSWTRATDFDDTPDLEISRGMFTFIKEGTAQGGTGWVLITVGGVDVNITLGVDDIEFAQFSYAGETLAGNGLSKLGNNTFVIDTTVTVDLTTSQILKNKTLTKDGTNLPGVTLELADYTGHKNDDTIVNTRFVSDIISTNAPSLSATTTTNGVDLNLTIVETDDTVTVVGDTVISVGVSGTAGNEEIAITIARADAVTDGYLSSADWNTFSNKPSTDTWIANVLDVAGYVAAPPHAVKVWKTDASGNPDWRDENAGGLGLDGTIKQASFPAVVNNSYFILGAITVTLPATPAFNDIIELIPVDGGVGAIIDRNTKKIMGLDENLTIDTVNSVVKLRYSDATYGWRLV